MTSQIFLSRQKDYESGFRKMNYDSEEEMNEVLGSLDDNMFINSQKAALKEFNASISNIIKSLGL